MAEDEIIIEEREEVLFQGAILKVCPFMTEPNIHLVAGSGRVNVKPILQKVQCLGEDCMAWEVEAERCYLIRG